MVKGRINLQGTLYASLAKFLCGLQQVRIVLEKALQCRPWDFTCSREGVNVAGFKELGFRILVEYYPVGAQVLAQDLQLLLSPWTAEHLLLAQDPIVPNATRESRYNLMTPSDPARPRIAGEQNTNTIHFTSWRVAVSRSRTQRGWCTQSALMRALSMKRSRLRSWNFAPIRYQNP